MTGYIRVHQEGLQAALKALSKAKLAPETVKPNNSRRKVNTVPVLQNVLISVIDAASIGLAVIDEKGERHVTTLGASCVGESFSVTVPFKTFKEVVNAAESDCVIELELDPETSALTVCQPGLWRSRLKGIPASEFPSVADFSASSEHAYSETTYKIKKQRAKANRAPLSEANMKRDASKPGNVWTALANMGLRTIYRVALEHQKRLERDMYTDIRNSKRANTTPRIEWHDNELRIYERDDKYATYKTYIQTVNGVDIPMVEQWATWGDQTWQRDTYYALLTRESFAAYMHATNLQFAISVVCGYINEHKGATIRKVAGGIVIHGRSQREYYTGCTVENFVTLYCEGGKTYVKAFRNVRDYATSNDQNLTVIGETLSPTEIMREVDRQLKSVDNPVRWFILGRKRTSKQRTSAPVRQPASV